MVLIHMKQNEDRQFLYECPASESVDLVIREVVAIHNLQLKILLLVQEGEQLSLYGPSRPPSSDDNEEDSDDDESTERLHGPFYRQDPARKRTGEACSPEVAETLKKMLAEAGVCASKDQVQHKVPLSAAHLKESLQNVRGAVMMCFPMGLPQYDPVHQLLAGTYKDVNIFDADTAQLWWAGKELTRDKKLSAHVGKNDKTKIIAKLQIRGHAPPPREPPVDSETQRAMMAWYYKQQQEQKKLEEDEEDSFTNSSWSNPKSLRCHLQGTSSIRYR